MVRIYTGRPGSGKSYNMAKKIMEILRRGRNVITTVPIDTDIVSKGGRRVIGDYVYIPISEITPEKLERYAAENHVKGGKFQTAVFIDECQIIFNSRNWNQLGRQDWIVFLSTHRHLGFDVYLITQSDSFVDKQIRPLIETEVKHKNISAYLWFLPFITLFVQREEWYGHAEKIKLQSAFVLCRKSVFQIYDSYMFFDEVCKKYKPPKEAL